MPAGCAAGDGRPPSHRLLVTDAGPQFGRFAARILGPGVELERVDVIEA